MGGKPAPDGSAQLKEAFKAMYLRQGKPEAEAERLATRYSGAVKRLQLGLQEEDSASLTQMQTRQLDDLVQLINTKFAFDTKIDDSFFIEGMAWDISDQGKVLEMSLDLEEK
jgi:hypothetical protein